GREHPLEIFGVLEQRALRQLRLAADLLEGRGLDQHVACIPSYSKVPTSRLGGTTSRYSPWNPNSFPSASRWTNRQRPPGRTSILSTMVEYRLGPHHLGISFGSVHAFHTSSRGASKVCVVTSSRSDFLTNLLFAGMFVFLLSSCITDFFEVFVQSGEAVLPQDAVSGEPPERRAERTAI